jgi:ubiquinone biosynthesis protein UbiJ
MPDYRTPFPALFAATLQGSLNSVLTLDETSASRIQRLDGRLLKLDLEGLGIGLFFTADSQGIQVTLEAPAGESGAAIEAETTISGTPAALFSMAASELGDGWGSPGSNVTISGDAALARDFERVFSRLDPDYEGALSGLFGDVMGHQLAVGLRQGARRARETADTAGEVLGEILREGSRGNRSGPAVGTDEARRFADGVDELREAVDRLEARIRMLDSEQQRDRGEQS